MTAVIVFVLLLASTAMGQTASPRVFLLLGPPGSGKTTQAKVLKQRFGLPAISASDVLKKSAGGKTPLAKRLKVQLASGTLVDDDTLNQLFEQRLANPDAANGFILDGYPASARQADFFVALLKKNGLPDPVVVHLEVPDPVARERMRDRRRADDQPAIIERRVADYRREEDTVLSRFGGQRVLRVDGTKPEREVTRELLRLLQ